MNPFDLRGPEFLLFYFLFAIAVLIVFRFVRRAREGSVGFDPADIRAGLVIGRTHPGEARTPLSDPYLIAYLRGGSSEVVRIAAVSLVDRGLLATGDDRLQATPLAARVEVRKQVERAILKASTAGTSVADLMNDSDVAAATEEYADSLKKRGLLAGPEMTMVRLRVFLLAAATLTGVSLVKIAVALSRGRHNIGILIVLTVIAVVVALITAFPRRTARGDRLLDELRNLFLSLKVRAPQLRPGGATAEIALLAAVFGVSALPTEHFSWTRQLFPRAYGNATATTSCGSSCGSSSCGGGGSCGGGCGGCGS